MTGSTKISLKKENREDDFQGGGLEASHGFRNYFQALGANLKKNFVLDTSSKLAHHSPNKNFKISIRRF